MKLKRKSPFVFDGLFLYSQRIRAAGYKTFEIICSIAFRITTSESLEQNNTYWEFVL